eukprot:3243031-Rhodomonas_salina.3
MLVGSAACFAASLRAVQLTAMHACCSDGQELRKNAATGNHRQLLRHMIQARHPSVWSAGFADVPKCPEDVSVSACLCVQQPVGSQTTGL